jgi:serine/threonine-protein kinase
MNRAVVFTTTINPGERTMPHIDRRLWQSVSPLLDQALDLEAGARAAFLASVRSTDPAIAAALEELIGRSERMLASDFLETSPLSAGSLPEPSAGGTIGAYTLERPLGMGGMGTVWLARRSDGRFEGRVALKLVNLAVFDPAARDRFAREGTLLARLAHPHIARLFDAGVTSAGQPYLVLEYVDGLRIDEYADTHRLDVRARLDLFAQVADAVAHAHANLVVHRDLKPSNILVDGSGRVKLLDFGIAKLVRDDNAGPPAALTVLTVPALTPRYAAPEQASGGVVTTATDVYALGVLLYELLSGGHPTIQLEADPVGQVRALVDREPLPMSEAVRRLAAEPTAAARIVRARSVSIDRLRRACCGDLDTIVAKALKKSPAERYATAAAFADDVRRHMRDEPVTARPDSLPYRAKKFVVRHRLTLAAAASVLVALVAGTAIAVLQARDSARQRDRALAELRRAEATNDFSNFLLSQAVPTDRPISNAELLARGEALIPKRFAKDAPLRVHMLLNLADRYQDNLQFEARDRVLADAYRDSQSISDVALKSYATCRWASRFGETGDFTQAFSLLDAVLPALSATSDYADVESRCRVFEASLANQNHDAARATAAAERAVLLEERRGGAPGRLFEPLAALATAYSTALRWDVANRTFKRAMGALESEGLDNTRTAAVLLNNWAVMLQEAGQIVEAAALAGRAADMARTADAENGPNFALLGNYASMLAAMGERVGADRHFEESLRKARAARSPRRLLIVLQFAIRSSCEAGDPLRAERLLNEASAVLEADRSASPYSKAIVEVSAARVALANGNAPRAVQLAERAASMLAAATPMRAGMPQAEILLASSLNASGRFAEALAVAEKSVRIAADRLGGLKHSYLMGQGLLEVANAKAGLGETGSARTSLASAFEHLRATVGDRAVAVQRAEILHRQLEAAVPLR